MNWIKMQCNLLKDKRIMKLTSEHGVKAFGVYSMVRLVVDGCQPNMTTVNGVYGELNTYNISKKLISTVICNYGLFDIDTSGYVHSVEFTPPEVSADYCYDSREGTREGRREGRREGTREGRREGRRARESYFALAQEEIELDNNNNAAPSAWGWAEATREESMDDGGHWGDMMPAEEGIGTAVVAEGA